MGDRKEPTPVPANQRRPNPPPAPPTEDVLDRVRSAVERMDGEAGQITLHVNAEGKVFKIERRLFESTATMPFDKNAVTP